jgi:hypothetical protein
VKHDACKAKHYACTASLHVHIPVKAGVIAEYPATRESLATLDVCLGTNSAY